MLKQACFQTYFIQCYNIFEYSQAQLDGILQEEGYLEKTKEEEKTHI